MIEFDVWKCRMVNPKWSLYLVTFFFRLQSAEEQLKKEANLTDIPDNVPVDSDVSSVLAAYKSEGDPDLYEYAYMELRRFVDESLDIYKVRINSCFRIIILCDVHSNSDQCFLFSPIFSA